MRVSLLLLALRTAFTALSSSDPLPSPLSPPPPASRYEQADDGAGSVRPDEQWVRGFQVRACVSPTLTLSLSHSLTLTLSHSHTHLPLHHCPCR